MPNAVTPGALQAGQGNNPYTFKGEATWHGKSGDVPVMVAGYAGKQNGRDFYYIENSTTTLPLDQLTFMEEARPQPSKAIPKIERGVIKVTTMQAGEESAQNMPTAPAGVKSVNAMDSRQKNSIPTKSTGKPSVEALNQANRLTKSAQSGNLDEQ